MERMHGECKVWPLYAVSVGCEEESMSASAVSVTSRSLPCIIADLFRSFPELVKLLDVFLKRDEYDSGDECFLGWPTS